MTRLPGGLHLRRAMPADAAALAAFAAQTFIDAFGADNDPANVAAYVAQVYGEAQQAREIADPNTITLLAEGPHGLAAYAQVRRTTPPPCVTAPHAVELHRIYLHRDWQGRTLAQRLMIAVHHAARELGGQFLYLGVWERNARAIAQDQIVAITPEDRRAQRALAIVYEKSADLEAFSGNPQGAVRTAERALSLLARAIGGE